MERMLESLDGPSLIAASGNGGVASAEAVPAAQSELEALQESMTRLLGMVSARACGCLDVRLFDLVATSHVLPCIVKKFTMVTVPLVFAQFFHRLLIVDVLFDAVFSPCEHCNQNAHLSLFWLWIIGACL